MFWFISYIYFIRVHFPHLVYVMLISLIYYRCKIFLCRYRIAFTKSVFITIAIYRAYDLWNRSMYGSVINNQDTSGLTHVHTFTCTQKREKYKWIQTQYLNILFYTYVCISKDLFDKGSIFLIVMLGSWRDTISWLISQLCRDTVFYG